MPLDPSIILGGQPAPMQSPLQAISAIAQLQDVQAQTEQRRQAGEKARQAAMDDAAMRQALTATGGDVDKALPQLRMINPRAAVAFEEQVGKARKESFDGLKSQTEYKTKQLEIGTRLLQGVTDQASHDLIRPMLQTLSPEVATALGDTYDPVKVQQFLQVGQTAKEIYDRRQDALKLFTEGKAGEALGTYFSTARTPQEWDGIAASAVHLGVPKDLVANFGPYSPENVTRAGQLAISPAKRAELAGQEATRAQTESHQTTQEEQTAARDRLAHTDRMAALAVARERLAKTAGGRPVTSGDARRVGDFNDARNELATLADTVSTSGATGVSAQVGASMPNWVTDTIGWGTDAKKKQAVIDRVKQVIGKTLEGGVLRKEDEIKYTKILPTISDAPEVVKAKMEGLDRMLTQKQQDHLDALADAGYDVSKFAARPKRPPLSERPPAGTAAAPDLTGVQSGHGRTFTSGPYAGQTWTTGPDGRPKRVS